MASEERRENYPQSTMLEDYFLELRRSRVIENEPLTGELKAIELMIEGVGAYEHGNSDEDLDHMSLGGDHDITIAAYAAVVYDMMLCIFHQI